MNLHLLASGVRGLAPDGVPKGEALWFGNYVAKSASQGGGMDLLKCKDEMRSGYVCRAGCGSEWTHQYAVEIYNRGEDGPNPPAVNVANDQRKGFSLSVDKPEYGNPSLRRQGIRMLLRCEGCEAATGVEVAQHKGQKSISAQGCLSHPIGVAVAFAGDA